jgi:hypothetical protein
VVAGHLSAYACRALDCVSVVQEAGEVNRAQEKEQQDHGDDSKFDDGLCAFS